MALLAIVASCLVGAVGGTCAIVYGHLPAVPGVGLGIVVALLVYVVLFFASNCQQSRPKREKVSQVGNSVQVDSTGADNKEKKKKKKETYL